jgi:hypothetical protein
MLHLDYSSQPQIGGEISLRSIKEKEFISIHPSRYIAELLKKKYTYHTALHVQHTDVCAQQSIYAYIRRKRGPCWRPMMMGMRGIVLLYIPCCEMIVWRNPSV